MKNQELKDLEYILSKAIEFQTKGKGNWHNREVLERDEKIEIPKSLANEILDEIDDRQPNYFWGWDENTDKIRLYIKDVRNRIERLK